MKAVFTGQAKLGQNGSLSKNKMSRKFWLLVKYPIKVHLTV